MKRYLIFMIILILLAPPVVSPERARAQETIAVDRPGLGSRSSVPGRGALQLEGGFEYSHQQDADLYGLGQAILPTGFSSLELQAAFNSLVFLHDSAGNEEGFRDLGLAVKAPLVEDWRGRFNLSVIGSLTLPTGADFLTADEAVPGVALLGDYSRGKHFPSPAMSDIPPAPAGCRRSSL